MAKPPRGSDLVTVLRGLARVGSAAVDVRSQEVTRTWATSSLRPIVLEGTIRLQEAVTTALQQPQILQKSASEGVNEALARVSMVTEGLKAYNSTLQPATEFQENAERDIDPLLDPRVEELNIEEFLIKEAAGGPALDALDPSRHDGLSGVQEAADKIMDKALSTKDEVNKRAEEFEPLLSIVKGEEREVTKENLEALDEKILELEGISHGHNFMLKKETVQTDSNVQNNVTEELNIEEFLMKKAAGGPALDALDPSGHDGLSGIQEVADKIMDKALSTKNEIDKRAEEFEPLLSVAKGEEREITKENLEAVDQKLSELEGISHGHNFQAPKEKEQTNSNVENRVTRENIPEHTIQFPCSTQKSPECSEQMTESADLIGQQELTIENVMMLEATRGHSGQLSYREKQVIDGVEAAADTVIKNTEETKGEINQRVIEFDLHLDKTKTEEQEITEEHLQAIDERLSELQDISFGHNLKIFKEVEHSKPVEDVLEDIFDSHDCTLEMSKFPPKSEEQCLQGTAERDVLKLAIVPEPSTSSKAVADLESSISQVAKPVTIDESYTPFCDSSEVRIERKNNVHESESIVSTIADSEEVSSPVAPQSSTPVHELSATNIVTGRDTDSAFATTAKSPISVSVTTATAAGATAAAATAASAAASAAAAAPAGAAAGDGGAAGAAAAGAGAGAGAAAGAAAAAAAAAAATTTTTTTTCTTVTTAADTTTADTTATAAVTTPLPHIDHVTKPEANTGSVKPKPKLLGKKPLAKEKPKSTLAENAQARKVPHSRIGRLVSFGGLAAGLGVGTIAEVTRRSLGLNQGQGGGSLMDSSPFLTEANARRIVDTLCRVRGAALKLGQMLSIQDSALINPQLQKIFERVRQSADFMPTWQLEAAIVGQLGEDWRSKVSTFDEKPFAAASIGQVHLATLHDGRSVAMKIQYPGVAEGIESDINNLVSTLKVGNIFPEGLFVDSVIEVAKKELRWECDYVREVECTQRFKELVSPYPELYVPEVVPELCTPQIFTSELIAGIPVDKCIDMDQASRNFICEQVLRVCLMELFQFGFMQTDPNWSNFFYNAETEQLALLDFGACREYDKAFVDKYINLIYGAAMKDRERVLKYSQDLGFLTGYEAKVMVNAHIDAIMILGEAFQEDKPFTFGDQNTTHRIQTLVPVMLSHRMCAPPEESYSLHRKMSGVFLLCTKLNGVVNCYNLFHEIFKSYRSGGTWEDFHSGRL